MRRLPLLIWGLVLAGLLVVEAPVTATSATYRCTAFGFQLPVPAGWHIVQTPCRSQGSTHLFTSNDGNGLLFALSVQPGLNFAHFAQDTRTRLAADFPAPTARTPAASAVTFGTLHVGSHTYPTARFTYQGGEHLAYYVAVPNTGYLANAVGVVLVFSAYVTRAGNPQAQAELVQAQASLAAMHLFVPRFTIKLKTGLPLAQSLSRLLAVILLVLAVSVIVLLRKLATTGRLLLGLLVLAIGATLLVFVVPHWLVADLATAGWVALVCQLLAWPFRAAAARRAARAQSPSEHQLPGAG